MIYDIDSGAQLPRVGTAPHWDRYRRAAQDQPDLVHALATTIVTAIAEQLAREPVINSSWLGARLLETFSERIAWRSYVGDTDASSTLFGMIVWTVIADDDRAWLSSLTKKATVGETDRVYWLRDQGATG